MSFLTLSPFHATLSAMVLQSIRAAAVLQPAISPSFPIPPFDGVIGVLRNGKKAAAGIIRDRPTGPTSEFQRGSARKLMTNASHLWISQLMCGQRTDTGRSGPRCWVQSNRCFLHREAHAIHGLSIPSCRVRFHCYMSLLLGAPCFEGAACFQHRWNAPNSSQSVPTWLEAFCSNLDTHAKCQAAFSSQVFPCSGSEAVI